ncbi:MAG: anaerobic sulfite reductase subunit AsrA [Spirochaetaceae bacterium]|jgi:anaerobic sulfite reductase subunit A|nr:anaerobic sulfite reductase subunit AsrA [Spirochaetaceae bacterium]
MGFYISPAGLNRVLARLREEYDLFAPRRFERGHAFSGMDQVRYAPVTGIEEVVFDQKSAYSFKECLLPITQNLFFFTEEQVKVSNPPSKRRILFLRSCDIHSIKRLDAHYLGNGREDYYYRRIRQGIRIVLMGCRTPFESCFCTAMGTNRPDAYDMYIEAADDGYLIDCKTPEWDRLFDEYPRETREVCPAFVNETTALTETVDAIPEHLGPEAAALPLWDEYDSRCINCGRCNFVCPTCGCYTMQDIFFSDNGKAGERRRVWASCMVDGFTDVAGGGSYRQKNGQRMRFKVLHKILDFKKRFGYHLCVGCGRCDDICPEYISFSHIINTLNRITAASPGTPKGGTINQ